MGSIDIAEKRRPQDGRIKMTVDGKHYDLRVSILPTTHGQSVRHAHPRPRQHPGEHQGPGLRRGDYARFQQIIKRPNGIFLVTGPTGSGKTTTLYAALNELNRPDRKIITAEDPVEYYLPGINQVEVKHQIGLDFAAHHPGHAAAGARTSSWSAKSATRDGRDRNPGVSDRTLGFQYAAHERCAQCYYTPGRYRRAAVPGGLVSVIAIMAQRLVRVVCPKCKEPDQPPAPKSRRPA